MKYLIVLFLFLSACTDNTNPSVNTTVPMNDEQTLLSWARVTYPKMACFAVTNSLPQYKYLDGTYCITVYNKKKSQK